MHETVAAEPPSPDALHDDVPDRRRQPPGDLGRAYRAAFVETGALEVVLPAAEPVPPQRPAPGAAARATSCTTATLARRTATNTGAVPAQRTASTASARTAGATLPRSAAPVGGGQLARRSRALLLGLAVGVVLGVGAVVLAGLLVAWLDLLPR